MSAVRPECLAVLLLALSADSARADMLAPWLKTVRVVTVVKCEAAVPGYAFYVYPPQHELDWDAAKSTYSQRVRLKRVDVEPGKQSVIWEEGLPENGAHGLVAVPLSLPNHLGIVEVSRPGSTSLLPGVKVLPIHSSITAHWLDDDHQIERIVLVRPGPDGPTFEILREPRSAGAQGAITWRLALAAGLLALAVLAAWRKRARLTGSRS